MSDTIQTIIDEMQALTPDVEALKHLAGHDHCDGWGINGDPSRGRCGCGVPLEDLIAAARPHRADKGWADGVCAACNRPVRFWERRGQGWQRRVILDPEPTDDGDTIIQPDGTPQGVIREDVVGRFVLHRSHFFTCPNHLEVPDG